MPMRPFRLTLMVCAVTAGCAAPGARAPGEIPSPGVYPAERTNTAAQHRALREEGWMPLSGHVAVLSLPGSVASLVQALPPTGSAVRVTSYAWPAPVGIAELNAGGVDLRGVPLAASRLSAEIRCLGLPADAPIGVRVRIAAADPGMRIEARIETPERVTTCDISWRGRKRLDALATDVWMWARVAMTQGSVIPAP